MGYCSSASVIFVVLSHGTNRSEVRLQPHLELAGSDLGGGGGYLLIDTSVGWRANLGLISRRFRDMPPSLFHKSDFSPL